jgi:regulator of chromosome condensation
MPIPKTTTKNEAQSRNQPVAPRAKKRPEAESDGQKPESPAHKRQKRSQGKELGAKVILNTAPSRRLDVFVFGSNDNGELGLGQTFKKAECNRPEFNPILSSAGVVQVSNGGMHTVALTYDNKILTWGVNDQGALGRDTQWEGTMVDIDNSESDEDEIEINPKESTPDAVDMTEIPSGTVFTQVAATDSASFALTEEGFVYGWGTFRGGNGIFGFSPEIETQRRPTLIRELRNVTKLAAGSNHVVALISDGTVQTWGSGDQAQLGRRVVERQKKLHALLPRGIGLRKGVLDIGSGSDHSFAVHKNGKVYGWGLNNYGQTGIASKAGEREAVVLKPAAIPSLQGIKKMVCIAGGNFNSIAVTDEGGCLVWGRIDNHATGIDVKRLPVESVIHDDRDRPRILQNATRVSTFDAVFATFGTEHAIAITKDGKGYSWGFNSSYQTGHPQDDDIIVATMIDAKSVRDKKLIWAGAGGQYGMLASEHSPRLTNGV